MGYLHSRSWALMIGAGLWLAVATNAPAEEIRTWTDSTGAHKREARFERLEGNVVHLRTKEGKNAKVVIEKLSSADQAYARQAAASGPDPFEEVSTPASVGPTIAEVAGDTELDDPKLRVVIAEGVGVNVEKAKKDAYREAVRQVVGAYVDSAQLLKNDKLIEDRIVTLSSAYVEKASPPLTTVNEDGIIRVKVRAWVRLTKVLETLKASNVVLKVDNTSFVAELQTRADQSEGEEALMSRVFATYPANSFKASVVGKPEIKKVSSSGAVIRIGVKFEPDLEQYLVVAQKIEAALGSTEREQGEFSVDGKSFPPNMIDDPVSYWYDSAEAFFGTHSGIISALPVADHPRLKSEERDDGRCPSVHVPNLFHLWPSEHSGDNSYSGLEVLARGKWAKFHGQADESVVFLMMTKSNNSGQRTRWRWFLLEKDEARTWFAPACKNMTCTLALLDGNDGELLEDRFVLSRFGWQLVYGNGGPPVYVCAPSFIHAGGDWYAPTFTYTRQIDVELAEIEGLASVKCSLANGDRAAGVYGITYD